ncbi:MAG: hypothetical protein WAR79_16535 [Melioribacteraceae bacterium]
MLIPNFSADCLVSFNPNFYHSHNTQKENELNNTIVLSVPMPYCKTVCKWRVCGSALPGYPVPMCYSCEQECWIHDSGRYFNLMR